jgi:hypothetical protein
MTDYLFRPPRIAVWHGRSEMKEDLTKRIAEEREQLAVELGGLVVDAATVIDEMNRVPLRLPGLLLAMDALMARVRSAGKLLTEIMEG